MAAHLAFGDRFVSNSMAEVREYLFAAACAACAAALAGDGA